MAEKSTGALLVTEDVKIVGIITGGDYARKVVLMGVFPGWLSEAACLS
jgi:hypothetical protein